MPSKCCKGDATGAIFLKLLLFYVPVVSLDLFLTLLVPFFFWPSPSVFLQRNFLFGCTSYTPFAACIFLCDLFSTSFVPLDGGKGGFVSGLAMMLLSVCPLFVS